MKNKTIEIEDLAWLVESFDVKELVTTDEYCMLQFGATKQKILVTFGEPVEVFIKAFASASIMDELRQIELEHEKLIDDYTTGINKLLK